MAKATRVLGGAGVLGAATVGALGVLAAQAHAARKAIGRLGEDGPGGEGCYGDGGEVIRLVMLGDSTSVGLGSEDIRGTPGARIARALSTASGRPVELTLGGQVGANSRHLGGQVERVLTRVKPDVAVVLVGANDVTALIGHSESAEILAREVARLKATGAHVVVGTCPDLGTIRPIAHPLRMLAGVRSKALAKAQTVAALGAGARTVSLGDLIGPAFGSQPETLFSSDKFHPSSEGYRHAADALAPAVIMELGYARELPSTLMSTQDAARMASTHPGTQARPALVRALRQLRPA